MKTSDFLILMLCCVAWAINFIVSTWALSIHSVPPFMLAAVRASIVVMIMGVFLFKPRPEKFGLLLLVCACIGPIHLGFLYTGLQTASASGSSIVSQILIPFSTLLSIIFLKERVRWVRGGAIFAAMCGVMLMIYEPGAVKPDIGLIYITLAYFTIAVGSILMKKVGGDIDWRQYVAWMAALVMLTMAVSSLLFETGQDAIWAQEKWPLLISAGYGAIVVTIFAHGQYFNFIKKYAVSQVIPLTLMVPVFACILGVLFLDEILYLRYIIGGILILPCVYVIARRQNIAPVQKDHS